MKEKKSIPAWSVVAAIAAALVLVAVIFVKGGSGDLSKDQLVEQRRAMDHSSGTPIAPAGPANARNVGNPQ